MKIIDAYESTVHTHYITDGERLTADSVRHLEKEMRVLLSELRIVFPLRVKPKLNQGRVEIVLECRPLATEADRIRKRLEELLLPLPRRPMVTARPVVTARALEKPGRIGRS